MPLTIINGSLLQDYKNQMVQMGQEKIKTQKQIFYLVPDHLKFQEEVSFLSHFAKKQSEVSFMNIQVLSFPRLAWFYLKNTAFYGENALSETGTPLLISKIIQENKNQLNLLKNQVNTYGFIGQLQKIFQEFQEGKVTPEVLNDILVKENLPEEIKEKLKEIQFLYLAFLEELPRFHFRDRRLLEGLNEALQEKDFSDTTFFIYGFERLGKEERDLVATFLKQKGDVVVSAPYEMENMESASFLNWMAEDVDYLLSLVDKKAVTWISLNEKKEGPQKILKEMWQQSFSKAALPKKNQEVADYLTLKKAPTPYEEVTAVAKEIRYLLTDKKVRFKEVSLFIRDYELYGGLIQYIFKQNEIPVLFSESKKMKNHPFLEFLNSLFRMEENHFQYRDVMRFLKTEYLWLNNQKEEAAILTGTDENLKQFQRSLDTFENIILANGFSGRYFSTKVKWHLVPPLMEKEEEEASGLTKELLKKETEINTFKDGFVSLLEPFFKKMQEKNLTNEKGVASFYQFILACGVKEKFAYFTEKAIQEEQLELARNYQQTWQVFCQILDEFQTIYQGLPFDYALFKETLTTAFENLTYEQIPQTIDHIQVNTLDTIYPKENDYVFVLGLNEKTLPKLVANETLLTDEERDFLSASFQELENQPELTFEVKNENQKENLRMYHLLMSAKKQLYLSYAAQIDTKQQNPSPFVLRVKDAFLLPMEEISPYQIKKEEAESLESHYLTLLKKAFTTPRQLIRDYAQNQFDPEKEKLDGIWEAENISHLLGNEEEGKLFTRMLEAWQVKNQPEDLIPEEAEALYGKDLHSSVSKMETFYRCQYRFFLQYGLNIKKREILELNPLVQGLLYHAVLEEFINQLMFDGKDLGQLQLNEVDTYFNQAFLKALEKEAGFKVFERTKQMGYIKNKLKKLLKNMVTVMHYQMQVGRLNPLKTELPYNHFSKSPEVLKGLDLPLSSGNRLFLKGFIDRLDYTVTDENKMYVTVIDYKSSQHTFDYGDAYEGLSMQMLTYLEVVLLNKDGILDFLQLKEIEFDPEKLGYYPGGALYLQIQNQVLEPREKLELLQTGDVSKTFLNPYRYKGLLVDEADFLQAIDPSLDEKKKSSLVFPTSNTNFVKEEELDLLLKKNQKNLITAGKTIQKGKMAINPYRKSNTDYACKGCPFRSICRFDPMTKESHYRELAKTSPKDILKKIGEEDLGQI